MESQSGGRVCLVGARGGRWVGSELVRLSGATGVRRRYRQNRGTTSQSSRPYHTSAVITGVPRSVPCCWLSVRGGGGTEVCRRASEEDECVRAQSGGRVE